MTEKEIIRKIYFFTEDKIYDCDVGMRVAEHSDVSSTRSREGGRWRIYEMSQAFDKLSELKEWLILQKEKANKELYECEHATWEKYKGSIPDHRNDHAKITGKIIACNDILEYIEKLKEE